MQTIPINGKAHDHGLRAQRLQNLLRTLKVKGLRMTPQRQAILAALVMHPGHPTVEELHQALLPEFSTMSLATVYKTMALLKQLGEVLELDFGNRDNRYDGCNPHPHPHLICTACGRIADPPAPNLAGMLRDMEINTGYAVLSHRLDFYGLCPACRNQR